MNNEKIDFVITWVNNTDSEWLAEKNKYDNSGSYDKRDNRYRDWGLLKYWFRAVEKNAPWVNKVFLVVSDSKQVPSWLNIKNKKLVLVNHGDFMPKEILPTFNSVSIELFLHKIPGLADNFVYFNDDMFLNSMTRKTDFFKNNLPCDSAILSAIVPSDGNDHFSHTLLSDAELMNLKYNIHSSIRGNLCKWFNLKYGTEQIRTLLLLPWNGLTGIKMHHIPNSYTKQTFKRVWSDNTKLLEKVATEKFRNNYNVNHWIFRYEQLLSGKFTPRNPKIGYFYILDDNYRKKDLQKTLNSNHKLICLNDLVRKKDVFEEAKRDLLAMFEKKYPEKSSFERNK